MLAALTLLGSPTLSTAGLIQVSVMHLGHPDVETAIMGFPCGPIAPGLSAVSCVGAQHDGLTERGYVTAAGLVGAGGSALTRLAGAVSARSMPPVPGRASISASAIVGGDISGPCNSSRLDLGCYELLTVFSWSATFTPDASPSPWLPSWNGFARFTLDPFNPYGIGQGILVDLADSASGSASFRSFSNGAYAVGSMFRVGVTQGMVDAAHTFTSRLILPEGVTFQAGDFRMTGGGPGSTPVPEPPTFALLAAALSWAVSRGRGIQ